VHLSALEIRARAALGGAEWQAAVAVAEEALALEPYRESAYQLPIAPTRAPAAGRGRRGLRALPATEQLRRGPGARAEALAGHAYRSARDPPRRLPVRGGRR
jgi:hypothetical protein